MSQEDPQKEIQKEENPSAPVTPTFARKTAEDAKPEDSSEGTPATETPKPTFKAPTSTQKGATGTPLSFNKKEGVTTPVFKMKTAPAGESQTEDDSAESKPADTATPKPFASPLGAKKTFGNDTKPKAAAAPAPRFKESSSTPKPKVKPRQVQAAPVEVEEQVSAPLVVVDLVAAAAAIAGAVLLYLELGATI